MCISRFMTLVQADQTLDKEGGVFFPPLSRAVVDQKSSGQMGLIDSNINHDEFVLINNVLNKYVKMKEEIKNLQA